jgi:hypothetical protein
MYTDMAQPFYRIEGDPEDRIFLEPGKVLVGVDGSALDSGVYVARKVGGFFSPAVAILQKAKNVEVDGNGAVDIGGPTHHALSFIDDFFTKRKERLGGRINSTMAVLHGPPGNGKSWAASSAIRRAQDEYGAIVLTVADHDRDMDGWNALKMATDAIRNAGIQNPIVWWVDDAPEHMWKQSSLEEFLIKNFDGRESRDNVLLVATTNYGYALPARVYNRPGRCTSIFFGPPTEEMLTNFFAAKGVPEQEVPLYVTAVYGQTLDAAANLVHSVQASGLDFRGLSREQEMRKALATRTIDYSVAAEILYGKLRENPDATVTLPDGRIINPVSDETIEAAEIEEKPTGPFPDFSREDLEKVVLSVLLSGLAEPANTNGRGTPTDLQQALKNYVDHGVKKVEQQPRTIRR